MNKYWIKLYHEILDDPKMGKMTDRLWRRTIELFLIAGDENGSDKTGILPSISDMAWRLRLTEEELETDLADLASYGIVHKSDDRWVVSNFNKRQAPMPKDEYMRRLRKERQRDVFVTNELPDSYQSVTRSNAEEEEEREEEKEQGEEQEKNGYSRIATMFENEIAALTPKTADIISEWIRSYSIVWVEDAIKIAVENNARKPSYVTAILENWKRDGKQDKSKKQKSYDPLEVERARLREKYGNE